MVVMGVVVSNMFIVHMHRSGVPTAELTGIGKATETSRLAYEPLSPMLKHHEHQIQCDGM
jgi:hypothetical protein